MSTLWVHQEVAFGLTTAGLVQTDESLSSVVDKSILSRATIVAIKGKITFQAIHVPAALVKPHAQVGLITGNVNLSSTDFPGLGLEEEATGYMWRGDYLGAAYGDATVPVLVQHQEEILNVKTKRKLSGVGV